MISIQCGCSPAVCQSTECHQVWGRGGFLRAGRSSAWWSGPRPACGSPSCLRLGWEWPTAYGPGYGSARTPLEEATPADRKDRLSPGSPWEQLTAGLGNKTVTIYIATDKASTSIENKCSKMSLNLDKDLHSFLGDVGRGKALAAKTPQSQLTKVGGINQPCYQFGSSLNI